MLGTILPLAAGTLLTMAYNKPFFPMGVAAGTALAPTSVGIALRLLGEAGVLKEDFGQAGRMEVMPEKLEVFSRNFYATFVYIHTCIYIYIYICIKLHIYIYIFKITIVSYLGYLHTIMVKHDHIS